MRQISYETPEGSFEGTITGGIINADFKNGKRRENLRFTIAVDPIPNHPLHDFRVRMDYWGNQDNDLLTDLYRLLGPDVINLTDENGEIIPDKLSLLEGKRVRFNVKHATRPGFDVPFRKAENLRPARPPCDQLDMAG